MTFSDASSGLGKIVINLQALEFAMRAFLYETHNSGALVAASGIEETPVGRSVPENALTNYDSLGQVIERFNSMLEASGICNRIDSSIVDLRDAIAHGRLLTSTAPLSIIQHHLLVAQWAEAKPAHQDMLKLPFGTSEGPPRSFF